MRCLTQLIIVSVSLCGCSSWQTSSSLRSAASDAPPQLRVAFAPECPTRPEGAQESFLGSLAVGIAVSIGQKAAERAIDALSTYLTSDKAYTLEDSSRMDGFAKWKTDGNVKLNDKEQCMIIVVGQLFSTPDMSEEDINNRMASYQLPFAHYDNIAVHNATGLISSPMLYLEAMLVPNGSDNVPSTHYAFQPVQWYYPDFIGDSSWRFNENRDVLLKVELYKPGVKEVLGSFEIKQSDMAAGGLTNDIVVNDKQPWNPLPSDLKAAPEGLKLDGEQVIYPVNVKALFVETSKPRTIVKYTGEAIAAQKTAFSTGVGNEIREGLDQATRLSNRSVAIETARAKYNDYVTAYGVASAAVEKYQHSIGNAKIQAQNEALLARKKLSISRALAKAAFLDAGVGDFEELPSLASTD